MLRVTALTDWSVDASGNSVLVRDGLGVPLTESMARYTYETWGAITGAIGACGSSTTCWNIQHGATTSELRIRDEVGVAEGDCLHVIAPVYFFGDSALFDITNWDWKNFYEPESSRIFFDGFESGSASAWSSP